jgi:hypothetical protein
MRLGLKSHVILDKILVEDSNDARIPQQVRQRVFREAAIVAAGLGGSEARAEEPDATADREPIEASRPTSTRSSTRSGTRWITGALALLLCSGSFFAGYTIADDHVQHDEIGVVTPGADFEGTDAAGPSAIDTRNPGDRGGQINASNPGTVEATEPAVSNATTDVSEGLRTDDAPAARQSSGIAADDPAVEQSDELNGDQKGRQGPMIEFPPINVEKSGKSKKDVQSQDEEPM